MRRRGFFGVLAGLCLAPLGFKRKPDKVPWRTVTRSWQFSFDPDEQAKIDERDRALRARLVHSLDKAIFKPPGSGPSALTYIVKT